MGEKRCTNLFLILSLLFSAGLYAGQEIPDYPAWKQSEHVYVIQGPTELPNPGNKGFMNNPVIVLTSKGAVIIDPGSSLYSGRMDDGSFRL